MAKASSTALVCVEPMAVTVLCAVSAVTVVWETAAPYGASATSSSAPTWTVTLGELATTYVRSAVRVVALMDRARRSLRAFTPTVQYPSIPRHAASESMRRL